MTQSPLYLRANNPSENINRWYSLYICQDLFGNWLLLTGWGRYGFKGQGKQYAFADEASAQKEFERVLKKRLNAQRRIGCNYQVVENL